MRPNSKTMQKKLAAYARMKPLSQTPPVAAPTGPPVRLRSGQPGAGMWDVYLDGERQHLCTFADTQLGRITRFKHGRGSIGVGKETENLIGVVEIVPKDAPCKFTKAQQEIAEFVKANPPPEGARVRVPMGSGRRFGRNHGVMLAATAVLLAAGVKVDHED